MHSNNEADFVARRTEALAYILLASRTDLTVMNAPNNSGVDLIVSIDNKRIRSFNHFGVVLKGAVQEIPDPRVARRVLKSLLPREVTQTSLSMPISIFLFSMVRDQGYYSWQQEPVTSDGLPRLRQHESRECSRLDQESLQAIVDAVNSYFDALSKVLVS
jgi:hypothetical protein